MAHDIFISYAKTQADISFRLCASLEAAGLRCWIAPRDSQPGRSWVDSAMAAIDGATVVIVVVSPEAGISDWVEREIYRAVDARKALLPVQLGDPPLSDRLQFLLSDIHRMRVETSPSVPQLEEVVEAARGVLALSRDAPATEHVSDVDLNDVPDVKPSDPFVNKVTVQRPAYFVLLLDCSHSMSQKLAGSRVSKKVAVADTVNDLLYQLLRTSRRTDAYRHFFDVSVLGYGLGSGYEVVSLLPEERMAVPSLHNRWTRIEDQERLQFGEDGVPQPVMLRQPVWIEPTSNTMGHTVMALAFQRAGDLVRQWTAEHPASIPPIVLNISDGEWTEANPADEVRGLQEQSTALGPTMVLNCQLAGASNPETTSLMFPASLPEGLPKSTEEMFLLSSLLPDSLIQEAAARRYDVESGARGFAFNSPLQRLVDFLQIGTRTQV
jgi:hypothetical protein